MREIKFTGKRVDNGYWIIGSLVAWDDKAYIIPSGCSLKKTFSGSNRHITSAYEVIPESVGQFTELQDKNGVDIYEGDIIKWKSIKDDVVFDECIVELPDITDYSFYAMLGSSPIEAKEECEIIGNIHDNPELLEVKDGTT